MVSYSERARILRADTQFKFRGMMVTLKDLDKTVVSESTNKEGIEWASR